jgi:hypothetical protein
MIPVYSQILVRVIVIVQAKNKIKIRINGKRKRLIKSKISMNRCKKISKSFSTRVCATFLSL